MRTAIIIPARYRSSRLPAKPLLKSTGKYLVQHVYERACQSQRARYVIVATDDTRVAAAVESFGGDCVITRGDHATGTDRVAEVAQDLDVDVIVNLQGDEPEVDPAAIDLLPAMLDRDADADVATLAVPVADETEWQSPSCVKVVCDREGRALYFSRRRFLLCATASRTSAFAPRGSYVTWGCMPIAATTCCGRRNWMTIRSKRWSDSNSCAGSPPAVGSRSGSSISRLAGSIRSRNTRISFAGFAADVQLSPLEFLDSFSNIGTSPPRGYIDWRRMPSSPREPPWA